MSGVIETSFFHPQNVGFFNSKSGQVVDANQTIDCGLMMDVKISKDKHISKWVD